MVRGDATAPNRKDKAGRQVMDRFGVQSKRATSSLECRFQENSIRAFGTREFRAASGYVGIPRGDETTSRCVDAAIKSARRRERYNLL
jgi:hypothetical protein